MGSNPTRAALFLSSEKKELFGLVAFPFFLFIEKSFHVYSMPYYTYGSTANFLFLGTTALIYIIYISNERRCNEDLHVVLEILNLNE